MAAPKTGHVLRVKNCNSAGGRALWGVRNPVKGNGAGQLVNVQTSEAPRRRVRVRSTSLLPA